MSAPLPLSDADIAAHIASIAGATQQRLAADDTVWIAENVRRWLSHYAYQEAQLLDVIDQNPPQTAPFQRQRIRRLLGGFSPCAALPNAV